MIKGKLGKLKKWCISISHNQTVLKILFGVVTILLLCAIPFIALKHGASADGFLGYFGAVIGGSIGALVAGWGIITTIKENRLQTVAPCLIFQEVEADKIPPNAKVNACMIVRNGNDMVFQYVRIKNVGSGAAIACGMGEATASFAYISDIIEKDAEKYIQIVCLINKFDDSPNNKSTHDEMMDYAFQTETIPLIFEYKNVLGEIHSYELIVKLQCDLSLPNGNVEKPKCSPTLKLISWKPLQ